MQNNIFSKVNVSTRIMVLILLILSILIANSIYFLLFLTIFLIILITLTNKSVKFYIDLIKNVKFWLLFAFIAYIIIFRNILNSFMFIYKIILILLIIKQFSLTVNIQSLSTGIKTLFKPIDKYFNLDKISYDIVIFIIFIKIYMETKDEIKFKLSLKYYILPRLFLTIYKVNKLESSLKLKFYKLGLEEKNNVSKIVLIIFILLFILVVFKEVIL